MIAALHSLALPLLHALAPEQAHRLTLECLRRLPLPPRPADDPALAIEAFGRSFTNPLGMAAGFDKNAEVPEALIRLGFGFAEVGTVTPRPQAGNPRPRVFRLREEHAILNRLGFNNEGHAQAHRHLVAGRGAQGIIGINLGANKDTADRAADYVAGITAFADVASYFAVNVSSPNTPGLRDLQRPTELDELVARVLDARDRAALRFGKRPVLLKIAPDLELGELDGIVGVARARNVDGMIIANTTVARPAAIARHAAAGGPGGISGRPLFARSTALLAHTYLRVDGQFPLVGVGGVESAKTAFAKITAGARLVELYTALVFKGLGLLGEIKAGIVAELRERRYGGLAEAVGTAAADWASGKLAAASAL